MKQNLLFIFIISSILFAYSSTTGSTGNISGTFKVGTTSGADYNSLSAAITAINNGTVTGNIVLEITSDLTESSNSGLGVDMGTFSLTIRPDMDADRTITFTQSTANAGPYGHLVIGCKTTDLGTALADGTVIATNNVTIDGYAVGSTTRRLKLTTSTDALTGSVLINVAGGSTDVTVKNCIIENKSTGSTPRCFYITQFKGTTNSSAPQNTIIENNIISSVPSLTVNGTAIQCTRNTSGSTVNITGLKIRNNTISASGTGIEIYYAGGVDITRNEIKIQKGTASGGAYGIWLRGTSGDMNIIANRFTETSTSQASGTALIQSVSIAASSSNPFNTNIYNNTFSGMDRKATGATAINQYYIGEIGYGTTKIYHNSFYLPALTQPTQAGAYNAIAYTTANYKADIQRNIFISNDNSKSVLISKAVTTGTMNNNVYFLRAGNSNARIVDTYATFSDYRTANSALDANSRNIDVNFVDAAAGNLLLTGTSVQDENLKVASMSAVPTDIAGTVRNTTFTYIGAHESTPFVVSGISDKKYSVSIRTTDSGIEINTPETTLVSVYNVSGVLVISKTMNGTDKIKLGKGVYLLKANNKIIKFGL